MDVLGSPSMVDLVRLSTRLVVTYAVLLAVARLMGRRMPEPGNRDILLGATLGGLVAPALVRAEDTPLGALTGIVLLFALNVAVSRLAFRYPRIDRLLLGPSRVLVVNGRLNRKELVREGITLTELKSIVEGGGVQSLADVESVKLDSWDGPTVVARNKNDAVLAEILATMARLEKRLPPNA